MPDVVKVQHVMEAMKYIIDVANDGLIEKRERLRTIRDYAKDFHDLVEAYWTNSTEYEKKKGDWDLAPPTLDAGC
jgi:hypothetical protein